MRAKDSTNLINRALRDHQWKHARRLIKRELRRAPGDHWLTTRLSTTYYEEMDYQTAVRLSKKALRSAPWCSLALWDYACALDMSSSKRQALIQFKKLVSRGVRGVAFGQCGEGLVWARQLINDARYRVGLTYADLGDVAMARKWLQRYMSARRKGVRSIYPMPEVRKHLAKVKGTTES